jgi:hypothetical protein
MPDKGVWLMEPALHATTGNQLLDALLRRFITRFEQSFPERIRAYYLGGSYSDGTAVGHDASPNSSDVDLFVIFRGIITEDETASFQRLLVECQNSSPFQVDAHAHSEDDLLDQSGRYGQQTSFLNALIREASVLIYGDDLRNELPSIPFSRYVLDVIESGIFHIGIPRQKVSLTYPLTTPLTFPLNYPDPAAEFYGYDAVPARPGAPRGTRVLVGLTAWIATFLLAIETRRHAGQKSQSIRLCKQYLPHDQRVQLVATINDLCKGAWGYALPDRQEDREYLRDLCRETLVLENEYLHLVQNYLLTRLQYSEAQEKRQIDRILQSIIYQNKE